MPTRTCPMVASGQETLASLRRTVGVKTDGRRGLGRGWEGLESGE